MSLWHNGPIEEYQVRDCTTGDDETFSDFNAADAKYTEWRESRPDHAIILIAVIAS